MFLFSAMVLSLKCIVEPPKPPFKRGMISIIGKISSNDRKFNGRPCLGVAVMRSDGALVFNYTDQFIGQKHDNVTFIYKPGSVIYKLAYDALGGISRGEQKLIPPVAPNVGFASMTSDGIITFQIRNESSDGVIGEGVMILRPSGPLYKHIVHQTGLEPGQTKAVPASVSDANGH